LARNVNKKKAECFCQQIRPKENKHFLLLKANSPIGALFERVGDPM